MGVAFGDVLAGELPLRWRLLIDEFAADPTLPFQEIKGKQQCAHHDLPAVERDEPVNLLALLNPTRAALSEAEKKSC